jgi:hypothetical protein
MDGTLCHPGTSAEHGSVGPVTTVANAPNQDGAADNSDNSGVSVLWACWFIVVATIHQLRQQIIDLRCQANYWQAQHQRAVQREADLKEEKQQLQALIRELQRRLFGRKTETSSSANPKSPTATPAPEPSQRRRRGQQAGSPSHGRRNHEHLPAEDEPCTLPEGQRCCPSCHEPFEEIPGTADGDILEVDVRAHRRCYHRQRYRRH